jgi:hypothetical protein
MSSFGYRLDRALTAIERAPEGRTSLRTLLPGTLLLISAGEAPSNMTCVVSEDSTEYWVFGEDLEDRSTQIAVDLRKPAAVGAVASAAPSYRWAC